MCIRDSALTVIALLFAFLRYRPSPFSVLDEIDAPLDEANVMRFGRFLQEFEMCIRDSTKNCTVRLGDVSKLYPEGSIVWITSGKKGEPKHRIYTAYLDKVRVKTMGTLTSADLGHQNPEINSREELIADFERIYKRRILMEDTVTVIYFSEVHNCLLYTSRCV